VVKREEIFFEFFFLNFFFFFFFFFSPPPPPPPPFYPLEVYSHGRSREAAEEGMVKGAYPSQTGFRTHEQQLITWKTPIDSVMLHFHGTEGTLKL